MQKYSRPKMRLEKGDTIQCHDLDELSGYFRCLVSEGYDLTVEEDKLLITVKGKHKEAADGNISRDSNISNH